MNGSSDMHYKGLQLLKEKRTDDSRLLKINKHFVIACIDIVKSKAAATHFETRLASIQAMEIDIGNKQHSRKQFNDLLHSVRSTINIRINEKLRAFTINRLSTSLLNLRQVNTTHNNQSSHHDCTIC